MKAQLRRRIDVYRAVPSVACLAVLLLSFQGLLEAIVVLLLQLAIAAQLSSTLTNKPPWSLHSVAVGFGIFLSLTSLCLLPLQAMGVPSLTWFVIPLLGVLHSLRDRDDDWGRGDFPGETWALWVITGTTLLVLAVINRFQFIKYGPPWSLNPYVSHFDTTGWQLLTNASVTEGLGSNGFISDWPLRYHWLALAWSGEIERNFQLEPFTALLFLLPWFSLLGLVVTVTSFTAIMTRVVWLRSLVPFVTLTGQLPGSSASVNINWDSVSQMASGALFISGVLIFLHLRTRIGGKWEALLLLALISCTLVGFKVSASIIFVASVVGVLVFHRGIRTWVGALVTPPLVMVFVGSLVGYFLFIQGGSSSAGLQFRNWNSAALSEAETSGSLIILLSAVFIAIPLLLGRAGITSRSRDGVNAGSAALLISLALIVFLEYWPPASTWFFTTACLTAIPASFVVAESYFRKHTQFRFAPAFFLSLLGVFCWLATSAAGWSIQVRQMSLVVVLWISALILSLIMRERKAQSMLALAMLAGVLVVAWFTPVVMLASQLAPTNPPIALGDSPRTLLYEEPKIAIPHAAGEGSDPPLARATRSVDEGMLVIVPVESGFDALTWAAQNRLRVYHSFEKYAAFYGGPGTLAELDRRITASDAWINDKDRASLTQLCDDGVEAIVTKDSTENESDAFTLVSLPCDNSR